MATIAASQYEQAGATARNAFERYVVALLGAIAMIWIVFQVVEIRAPFPPIGILYAVGSIAVAGLVVRGGKTWAPAVAAGWAVLMIIPESIPAIGHLRDWSELYTHFGHYLVIVTFFPLAALLAAVGIAATAQNRAITDAGEVAPAWLRVARIGVLSFIVVANLITIMLYVLEIP